MSHFGRSGPPDIKDTFSLLVLNITFRHPWVQVDGVAPDNTLDSAVLSRLTQFSAMDKLKKMALRGSYIKELAAASKLEDDVTFYQTTSRRGKAFPHMIRMSSVHLWSFIRKKLKNLPDSVSFLEELFYILTPRESIKFEDVTVVF